MHQPAYHIFPLGDSGLTITFGDVMDPEIHALVIDLFHHLKTLAWPYVHDLVPGYTSLSLYYDLVTVKHLQKDHLTCFEWMAARLHPVIQGVNTTYGDAGRTVHIPVCYAPKYGTDIENMAVMKRCTTDDIIQLHTSPLYRVFMIGFLPGFPYMGIVDERLATPRRKQPRLLVPGGSVGIAGHQTGIYPVASPGGWQIIGRTPITLFNPGMQDPVLLHPGDSIRFYSITEDEFENY